MSTMELTHDAAQAEVTRLLEQQREWTRKREQLGADLALLQGHAGEQALAGDSTAEIADRITRMQTEVQIADRALQALDTKIDEAKRVTRHARIADERARAAQLREQAAAIRAEAEPHMAALERIEGVRPMLGRCKSQLLEEKAHRFDLGAEYQQFQLENPR